MQSQSSKTLEGMCVLSKLRPWKLQKQGGIVIKKVMITHCVWSQEMSNIGGWVSSKAAKKLIVANYLLIDKLFIKRNGFCPNCSRKPTSRIMWKNKVKMLVVVVHPTLGNPVWTVAAGSSVRGIHPGKNAGMVALTFPSTRDLSESGGLNPGLLHWIDSL